MCTSILFACCQGAGKSASVLCLPDYAVIKPHDALVIDATKGNPIFIKNFESVLNID
jgi:hypothetical protein